MAAVNYEISSILTTDHH